LSAFLSETSNNFPSPDYDHDNDSDYDNNYNIPRNRPPLDNLSTISSQRLGTNSLLSLSLSAFLSETANNLPSLDYDYDNDSDYD
jgi:hypothetical protein